MKFRIIEKAWGDKKKYILERKILFWWIKIYNCLDDILEFNSAQEAEVYARKRYSGWTLTVYKIFSI